MSSERACSHLTKYLLLHSLALQILARHFPSLGFSFRLFGKMRVKILSPFLFYEVW